MLNFIRSAYLPGASEVATNINSSFIAIAGGCTAAEIPSRKPCSSSVVATAYQIVHCSLSDAFIAATAGRRS